MNDGDNYPQKYSFSLDVLIGLSFLRFMHQSHKTCYQNIQKKKEKKKKRTEQLVQMNKQDNVSVGCKSDLWVVSYVSLK